MKKSFVAVLLFLFGIAMISSAQLSAGYNSDGHTLSVSTNILSKVWGELRVNVTPYNNASWAYSDGGITQAYCFYRIFDSTPASIYIGGGTGINLLAFETEKWVSFNFPAGIRINPFEKLPELYIVGEYNPMIIPEEGVPIIHSVSVGFRYRLVRGE